MSRLLSRFARSLGVLSFLPYQPERYERMFGELGICPLVAVLFPFGRLPRCSITPEQYFGISILARHGAVR